MQAYLLGVLEREAAGQENRRLLEKWADQPLTGSDDIDFVELVRSERDAWEHLVAPRWCGPRVIVMDASVFADLLTGFGRADQYRPYAAADPHWAVPEHFTVEVASAFRGAWLGGMLGRPAFEEGFGGSQRLRSTSGRCARCSRGWSSWPAMRPPMTRRTSRSPKGCRFRSLPGMPNSPVCRGCAARSSLCVDPRRRKVVRVTSSSPPGLQHGAAERAAESEIDT